MTSAQPEGFLAPAPDSRSSGILVLHAWWGLNDTLKAFCKRLADAGFTAFAPDLYHGQVAATIPEAEALGGALEGKHKEVRAEIRGAADFLYGQVGKPAGGLAVIGFSMGAYYSLDLSAADPDQIGSVVVFYGTGPADFTRSKAAYLGHFAENDPFEPGANVDALESEIKAAGRPVTFHRYPGTGHWFFEPDRPDAYHHAAAELAWGRTLAFLKK
jgi:carboxymethylenebutenolidase